MVYGPYRLKSGRSVIPRGAVGVYWLAYRGSGPIRYVGSNPDGGTLRSRLADHASKGQYAWFWFEVTSTARAARSRECEEYVRLGPQLENKIRPPLCRLRNHHH